MLATHSVLADSYVAPRTFFGQPDLQGTWTNATITTLERPEEFSSLVLTAEEAAAREAERRQFYDDYDNPEKEDGQLAVANDPGGYNTFWMDEGTQLARIEGEYRSSIIVYPEDGQIPYTWGARWKLIKRFAQFLRYDGPEVRLLGERCLVGFGSTGGPPMLPVLYNNSNGSSRPKTTW